MPYYCVNSHYINNLQCHPREFILFFSQFELYANPNCECCTMLHNIAICVFHILLRGWRREVEEEREKPIYSHLFPQPLGIDERIDNEIGIVKFLSIHVPRRNLNLNAARFPQIFTKIRLAENSTYILFQHCSALQHWCLLNFWFK